ncbi:MAG: 3-dehydroquinate synthase [Verrucomicrobiota bacterium]
MIKPLTVELGDRSYPIHFSNSLEALRTDIRALRASGKSLRTLADKGALQAQPDYLTRAGFTEDEILVLPAGEPTKSLQYLGEALSFLAQGALNRDSSVFAFGGGVTGDLAGYTAASYLRGIDFYQIPTTLLSMVDSSVGGKTGINLPEGKNLVGAFWQPQAVYIETALLQTLSPREFAAGMAEVIKYGMLADLSLFEELEDLEQLDAHSDALSGIVRQCCALKARIVAEDEKETASSGGRALLNLGHTFAHAIENVAGYGDYLHGEAVAIGLKMAAQLSVELSQIDASTIQRVEAILAKFALPVALKSPLPVEALVQAMTKDKKNRSGKIRFVSMQALGKAVTTEGIETKLIEQILIDGGANR